jgi:hypothetical protein
MLELPQNALAVSNVASDKLADRGLRTAGGFKQVNVGGEDVNHPLPDVQIDIGALAFRSVSISGGIIEEDFVLAHMNENCGKI